MILYNDRLTKVDIVRVGDGTSIRSSLNIMYVGSLHIRNKQINYIPYTYSARRDQYNIFSTDHHYKEYNNESQRARAVYCTALDLDNHGLLPRIT